MNPADPTPEDLRRLSNRELDALYEDLRKRAFAHFDAAAQKADAGRSDSEATFAEAKALADPLIARAAVVGAERAARLRRAARAYRLLALIVTILGACAIAWLLMRR